MAPNDKNWLHWLKTHPPAVMAIGGGLALLLWIGAPSQSSATDRQVQERAALGIALASGATAWYLSKKPKT